MAQGVLQLGYLLRLKEVLVPVGSGIVRGVGPGSLRRVLAARFPQLGPEGGDLLLSGVETAFQFLVTGFGKNMLPPAGIGPAPVAVRTLAFRAPSIPRGRASPACLAR
jgi:hypothetical protein